MVYIDIQQIPDVILQTDRPCKTGKEERAGVRQYMGEDG